MRGFLSSFVLIATSAAIVTAQNNAPFSINDLRSQIDIEDLLADSQTLEDFAYATSERNRVFGSPGHNATVNFLFDELSSLDDYYTVSLQPFEALFSDGDESFTVNGADQNATLFTYTPSGLLVDTPIVAVSNLGCEATDYPPEVSGNIALISRGVCPFGLKSALAGSAGAAGVVIYNNVVGNLAGTLGDPSRSEGPYAPTVGIPLENGQALLALLSPNSTNSSTVVGNLEVNSILENRTTYNVIAQTNSGNQDSVLTLGAHTDSVNQGPGINDNGSGTIGILAVARALAQFSPLPDSYNSVRFLFWSAEEFGLLGSDYYVTTLPAAERSKIRAYLNFDMIASPNYIYGIYDGDGSSFNLTGPPGSDTIEALFESYYASEGLDFAATAFSGRSDYAAFIDAGIPAGGLFTGAEQVKTEEEAAIFGGVAGVAFDENYHEAGDNVTNLNVEAFAVNTEAIAYAVGTLAESFAGIPERNATANATMGMERRSGMNGMMIGGGKSMVKSKLGERAKVGAKQHTHKQGGCANSRVEI